MAAGPIDIDRIVRDVLADLGMAPQVDSSAGSSTGERPPAKPKESSQPTATSTKTTTGEASDELVVQQRVVTLADLDGRLDGIRRLVVPPQSVVTPSVRDELDTRRIKLAYAPVQAAEASQAVRLVLVSMGSRYDPAPLVDALRQEGVSVQPRRADCLVRATDELAGELNAGDAVGLLVTTYPAIALCLANRHQGVRAVWAIDPGRAGGDAASVGANLLVVDPKASSVVQIKQMIQPLCREVLAECPEALRERLG